MRVVTLVFVIVGGAADAVSAQPEATLFAPGTISTEALEYGATFSPSGDTLYFTRRASFDDQPQIYRSVREANGWSNPTSVSFSHAAGDEFPFVAADGRSIYFSSARPVDGVDQRDRNDLWVVERSGDSWGEPRHLGGDFSTPDIDSHPVVTEEGLFFHSRRSGGTGGVDAYVAARLPDGWARPVPLPFNSPATDGEVVPMPHGGLVFYSDRDGGFGRGDLYRVERRGDGWSAPENLGPVINTPAWEWAPSFHPDGRFVFARLSEDGSRSDLYLVRLPESGR